MNFEPTDEQRMLVQSAEQFAKKDSPVERFRRLRDTQQGWEKEMWRKMGSELGWLGIPFSEEMGGIGGGLVDTMLILEQLGRALVPEPYVPSVILAGMTIAKDGTAAQAEQFVVPMIEGAASLALAYAEKTSRYDPRLIAMKAEKSGSDYVLSGEKIWVLNGHAADQIVVAARTAGAAGDSQGLTLFVVDGNAPGLTRTAVHGMDGRHTGLLKFDKVKVPAERAIGPVDGGLGILERALDRGAAMAVAEGSGICQECLTRTVEYLKVRVQFGVPIGSFQALQHRAADLFIQTELVKSVAILAGIQGEHEDETTRKREVSAAKVTLTKSGYWVAAQSIQLHGGIGCTDEQDVGLFFKRMHTLNHLFGDADYHLGRYRSLPGFEEAA